MATTVPTQPPIIISQLVIERLFSGNQIAFDKNENHGVLCRLNNPISGQEKLIWYYEDEEKITIVPKTE